MYAVTCCGFLFARTVRVIGWTFSSVFLFLFLFWDEYETFRERLCWRLDAYENTTPDQHAADLTPGTKCMPLVSVFFFVFVFAVLENRTVTVGGFVDFDTSKYVLCFAWDEDETFRERRYWRVDAYEKTTIP